MDPKHPEIVKYVNSLPLNQPPAVSLATYSFQPSKASKLTVPIPKTLIELAGLDPYTNKDQQFSCTATIIRILNEDNWSYPACPECKVSAYYDGEQKPCRGCGVINPNHIQWYRIVVMVEEDQVNAEFTIMGKQAETIVGMRADALYAQARRTNEMVPRQLLAIIGKRFLFTVDINITQLHRQKVGYDINKVEPIPPTAMLPGPGDGEPSILPMPSPSLLLGVSKESSSQSKPTQHTGLSPQNANIKIRSSSSHESCEESSQHNIEPSQSSTHSHKRKLFDVVKEDEETHSSQHFAASNPGDLAENVKDITAQTSAGYRSLTNKDSSENISPAGSDNISSTPLQR